MAVETVSIRYPLRIYASTIKTFVPLPFRARVSLPAMGSRTELW